MKIDRRWLLAMAALGVALAAWLLASLGLLWATLEGPEQALVAGLLGPRAALLFVSWLVAFALAGWLLNRLYVRHVAAPARLAEQAQVLLTGDAQHALAAQDGAAATQGLAQVINQLVQQRTGLSRDMDRKVREASRGVEQERSRLAALMAELTQSVVVCNLDGRVLLYNSRARLQFRALVDAPLAVGGAEAIGLGRSIYTVLDRRLVAHALETVQQRLSNGAANPSAQFVTATRAGQLLRVQLAPVREVVAADGDGDGDGERDRDPGVAGSAPGTANSPAARDTAREPGAPGAPAAPVASAALAAPAAPAASAASAASAALAAAAAPAAPGTALSGFVLMLDNITRDFEQESLRDRLLHGLTEGSRASLANLQAAVEMLEYPDLEAPMRERFHGVIRDEVAGMSRRIRELADSATQGLKTQWPVEEMLGADLVSAALRRIEDRCQMRAEASEVDDTLWLKVDSFALLQALAYLAGRLNEEFDIKTVQLRLSAAGPRAHLDLVWSGQAMSTETVMGWQMDPMHIGADSTPMTVRDVAERHGGEFWFERERARHLAFFRFLLPLATPQEQLAAAAVEHNDSRPEYYDFDLFETSDLSRALDDRLLIELSYTVFDTETTGLAPSQGDEIIQIGAARIVAGKLRRQDCFEQLVDPKRDISAASIPIHGIRPDMVAGQPTIGEVLPAFHAFAQDTVLVAHNAAFDMRFLQLKEAATGVRFEQPVLDTLLLSALVHPNQESHRLEAIAERFGVTVAGRHTAMGDAFVTAEVFLKLIPLLADKGIHTLGQAREAAQKTYYARVQY